MKNNTPALNLPAANLRTEPDRIFDPLRKKWVALTPEEWVRQNFLAYLVACKKYPKSLIKVEESIKAFDKTRRCDAVIYSNQIKALAILECKAPGIKITDKTFRQIAVYNSKVGAPFLFVTNGIDHFCCQINLSTNQYTFRDHIPDYAELAEMSVKPSDD